MFVPRYARFEVVVDERLQSLLADPRIFRPRRMDGGGATLSTGHIDLDACLPGGGWRLGKLNELLAGEWGIGELRLLMPALQRQAVNGGGRLLWVAPPYLPYAPALAAAGLQAEQNLVTCPERGSDRIWVVEQALLSGACSAVLAWDSGWRNPQLRRLQLAAQDSAAPVFLFRSPDAGRQPSPASLRLQLAPHPDGLEVMLLKVSGGRTGRIVLRDL